MHSWKGHCFQQQHACYTVPYESSGTTDLADAGAGEIAREVFDAEPLDDGRGFLLDRCPYALVLVRVDYGKRALEKFLQVGVLLHLRQEERVVGGVLLVADDEREQHQLVVGVLPGSDEHHPIPCPLYVTPIDLDKLPKLQGKGKENRERA